MNQKIIDRLMDDPIPEADLNARKIAINAALSQFSKEVDQGMLASTRPIHTRGTSPSSNSKWCAVMNFIKNPTSGRVFASVAIGFVALAVVNQLPKDTIQDTQVSIENYELIVGSDDATQASESPVIDIQEKEFVKTSRAEADVPMSMDVESESTSDMVTTSPEPAMNLEEIAVTGARLQQTSTDTKEVKTKRVESLRSSISKPIAKQRVNSSHLNRGLVSLDSFEAPAAPMSQRPDIREQYTPHQENELKLVQQEPVSTFSADVDTASYSLLRNQLQQGFLPAPTAVRTEEVINYFSYNYPHPDSKSAPFRASVSVLDSPWNESKKLIHIGIKGYDIEPTKTPDSNLVFLLDVSGSMNAPNKLPLVKRSIGLLLKTLKPSDTVSIVVYAGAAGAVLEPTQVKDSTKILAALQHLNAGGSTAGGAGIELAYQLAEKNLNSEAVNRIILATDGDFNVGQQSNETLKTLVARKRESGVLLSVLGFGRNNYQDDMMQTLAQSGNGVAAYIDSLSEAKKVLVDQASSTLFNIAKDVKFQVEFNPQTVSEYRLVGYETRQLNRDDFNNDKVDAGDIGSGHTVTAIYEITLVGASSASIDPLRYAKVGEKTNPTSNSNEYGFLKMRYKLPGQTISKLIEQPISAEQTNVKHTDNIDVTFSIAAASFAQYLKGGKYIGDMSLSDIAKMARLSKGDDSYGYRSEFIQLVELASIAAP